MPALAQAAVVSRNVLKSFFTSGDHPTAQQFSTFIDSSLNLNDDGLTTYRTGYTSTSRSGFIQTRTLPGTVIGPDTPFTTLGDYPLDPAWENNYGFLAIEFLDSSGLSHYGYVEMSQGPIDPANPDNTGIVFVDSFAYETQASTAITATSTVPEPSTLAILLAAPLLLRRRQN